MGETIRQRHSESTASLVIPMTLYAAQIIWGIFVMSRYVRQHNTVNKIYNLNTFGQKA